MGMKRGLVFLAFAALGFAIASTIYKLIEPFLPMLPGLLASLVPILTSGWFLAGLIGAILAVVLLILWARSGVW